MGIFREIKGKVAKNEIKFIPLPFVLDPKSIFQRKLMVPQSSWKGVLWVRIVLFYDIKKIVQYNLINRFRYLLGENNASMKRLLR